MVLPSWLLDIEARFSFEDVMVYHNSHLELPVFAVSMYLVFIFYVPDTVRKGGYNLKSIMAVWNLFLAVFSIIGATRLVPQLLTYILRDGLVASMCNYPASSLPGPAGLWMMLFIYSKFFELLDTVFLVLHNRPVIFLHWFHHVTVLLYCWLSYGQAASTGLWFAAMNYCVHSIMYFYYFLMIFKPLRGIVRTVAPGITTIQISQMVGGMLVSATAAWQHLSHGAASCKVESNNWKLGLAMYAAYFFLFATLFASKFCKSSHKKKSSTSSKDTAEEQAGVCNATDAAGMFRGSRQDSQKSKAKKGGKKNQ